MHFTKTLVSLFAISGFAAARFEHSDSSLARREVAEVAYEDFLVARNEYIEKRDLVRRVFGTGHCASRGYKSGKKSMRCMLNGKYCGPCHHTAATGQGCLCNLSEEEKDKGDQEKKKKEKEEKDKKKKDKKKTTVKK